VEIGGLRECIFLAFFCYYGAWIAHQMARTQMLPIPVAAWLPNVVLGTIGLVFMARMERPATRRLDGVKRRLAVGGRFRRKDDAAAKAARAPWKVTCCRRSWTPTC